MAKSFLKDKKRVLPVATHLSGQYGQSNLYVGVPAVIGAGGVEKVIEMKLGDKEKEMLEVSAKAVRELVALLPYGKGQAS